MSRVAAHPIEPLILNRWSPRAMSGEAVTGPELSRLLEAARWAPSAGNTQPWRFAYALAATDAFQRFHALLHEGNQAWCQRAGALLVLASLTVRDGDKPLRKHAFDAGAAWMALALQGSAMGLVVHGMGGFDHERARSVCRVPATFDLQCMVAVGRPGRIEDLSEQNRSREKPSDRQPIGSFAFEGAFPGGESAPR